MLRQALVVLIGVFMVAPAFAQEPDSFQQANADARLGGQEPFARLTIDGAWGDPADAFAFFLYWDKPYGEPGRRRGFAVRKASRTSNAPVWANSFDCAPVENVMIALEDVEPPRIDVPGIGNEIQRVTADGASFVLTTRESNWSGLLGYGLKISSNYGTPLADWAQRLNRELDDCWSPDPPEMS